MRLPRILDEEGQLVLWDALRPRLLNSIAACPRLLQVQQHRPDRACSGWTGTHRGAAPVGAFDVGVAELDEIEEALDRAEDPPRVGEPDERLHRLHPVPLAAQLDQVVPSSDRHVVEYLDPGVVVLHRNEKRHT